jgi:hypothetical protein
MLGQAQTDIFSNAALEKLRQTKFATTPFIAANADPTLSASGQYFYPGGSKETPIPGMILLQQGRGKWATQRTAMHEALHAVDPRNLVTRTGFGIPKLSAVMARNAYGGEWDPVEYFPMLAMNVGFDPYQLTSKRYVGAPYAREYAQIFRQLASYQGRTSQATYDANKGYAIALPPVATRTP